MAAITLQSLLLILPGITQKRANAQDLIFQNSIPQNVIPQNQIPPQPNSQVFPLEKIPLEILPLELANARSLLFSQSKPQSPTSKPESLDAQTSEDSDNNGELMEENPEETSEETDLETAEQESDSKIPPNEPNPFNKPNIDKLIEQEFNQDFWRILKGGLPCLEVTAVCLQQLQERAVVQSPLLKELDTRIGEANEKINQAKTSNQRSIRLSVLTPALQYLLGPPPTAGQPQRRGLIENIVGIFSGDVGLINGLLNVIGVPLFQGVQGGNSEAQARSIQISDLQIKVAELQRNRAQLADQIRERTILALVKFDEAKTEFQTAQVLVSRSIDQFKLYELRYTRGNSDTEVYLGRLNQLDGTKAQTYRSWAKMRRSLFELKLLVLSVKEAEL